jgi:hypothetical protein
MVMLGCLLSTLPEPVGAGEEGLPVLTSMVRTNC